MSVKEEKNVQAISAFCRASAIQHRVQAQSSKSACCRKERYIDRTELGSGSRTILELSSRKLSNQPLWKLRIEHVNNDELSPDESKKKISDDFEI